jgi:hypothetical protein
MGLNISGVTVREYSLADVLEASNFDLVFSTMPHRQTYCSLLLSSPPIIYYSPHPGQAGDKRCVIYSKSLLC